MKKYVIVSTVFALSCGTALAAKVPLDCKTPNGEPPYKAEIINDGTMNRSVQIAFARKPSKAQATKTVQACVHVAVTRNGSVDALGSAWVGGKPVALGGGMYYAYFSAKKKYQFM